MLESYKGGIPKSREDGREIVIPHRSPVNKGLRKKKRIAGGFAPMQETHGQRLTDPEFKVFAAMMALGGWRGGCHVITNEAIRNWTGKKKFAIERAQAGLKRKGFIERQPSPKKWGALWKINRQSKDILAACDDLALLFPDADFNGSKVRHETRFNGSKVSHREREQQREKSKMQKRSVGRKFSKAKNGDHRRKPKVF